MHMQLHLHILTLRHLVLLTVTTFLSLLLTITVKRGLILLLFHLLVRKNIPFQRSSIIHQ
uniref:Uncharacterized protein n=1 Tax=uncultured marine virus TaxID=186617 RepID=A0A0F7L9Z3_9VIRU|nr:hypothetical protein [uncultured marine virus]